MEITLGEILEGKVTGVTKFGAFVALPNNKSGMIHISEVAPTFVKEISDFITMGQDVKVKVISIDANGRIALSIKQAVVPERREPPKQQPRPRIPVEFEWGTKKNDDISFEDKLNRFKQDSDERLLDLKKTIEGKRAGSSKRSKG